MDLSVCILKNLQNGIIELIEISLETQRVNDSLTLKSTADLTKFVTLISSSIQRIDFSYILLAPCEQPVVDRRRTLCLSIFDWRRYRFIY